ncbi:MAG TPA: PAS domain S-box protein [Solirubrobacteraceae bacterium]
MIISFRDITERQRTHEELQQFAALVSLSSDFIASSGLDGRVLYLNEAGRALTGLDSLEQARTKYVPDFHTEEGRRHVTEVEQPTVLTDGRWEGEGTLRNFKTGAVVPVRISSYLVRHPDTHEPWAMATVQRDLSLEKRATAQLIASHERYEAQFRSLPLPAYVWRLIDDDFVLIEWNAAAEAFTRGGVASLAGARAMVAYGDSPALMLGFERCWSTRAPVSFEIDYQMLTMPERKHLIMTYAFVPPDLVLVHTLDITSGSHSSTSC